MERAGVNRHLLSDDRVDKVPLLQLWVSDLPVILAINNFGAVLRHRCVHLTLELDHLPVQSEWAQRGLWVHRVSNNCVLVNHCDQLVSEGLVNARLNNESLRVDACLCISSHATLVCDIGCPVQISVLQHYKWIVATQLKASFLYALAALGCNSDAASRASCELDSMHSLVRNDLSALLIVSEQVLVFAFIKASITENQLQ